jgi:hypothetical protein
MKSFFAFLLFCAWPLWGTAQEDTPATPETEAPAFIPRSNRMATEGQRLYFRPKVDFSIGVPATIWSLYAFTKIYDKPDIDTNTVKNLNRNNVPSFDRWAVRSSDAADAASNIPFYASIPYPLILLADKDIRHDAGRVYGLYWEAMSITGLLYTGGDYFVDRYRPEAYDESRPPDQRTSGNEKNAFFAGHVALVSTATFFTASVYDIYHPASKLKWALYGIATAATGTSIYLRYRAGKHWPSDLAIGTVLGVGCGMLVPRLHRNKPEKKHAWLFSPYTGPGYGVAAAWHF